MSLFNKLLNALVPAQPNVDVSPIQLQNKYATGETLYFPSNLESGGNGAKRYPHFMKFNVFKFTGGVNGNEKTQVSRTISSSAIKSIFLHIPDNVTQTTNHEYTAESITTALANYGLAGAAGQSIADVFSAAGDALAFPRPGAFERFKETMSKSPESLETIGRTAEGLFGAGQGTTNLLTQMLGNRAVNPRYEVLYGGTRPREFVFDFKMSPKNVKESQSILNIIRAFRYYSSPETTDEDRYVIPPNPFQIEFYFGAGEAGGVPNQALFKINTCFLEGVDVNYTSMGQFATFKDGMPVEIAMQLRFKEIQILTREKIEEGY